MYHNTLGLYVAQINFLAKTLFHDLFARTFQPVPGLRISLSELKHHPALRGKSVEEESSTEEEAVNEPALTVEW